MEEINGLWRHISTHAPSPEREEILNIIGPKLIDDNQNLYVEVSTLKSILLEMKEVTAKALALENAANPKRTTKGKGFGAKKMLAHAKTFSELYYSNNNPGSSLSNSSFPSVLRIYSIKSFTLEYVMLEAQDFIREAFMDERIELEQIIADLNADMDFTSCATSGEGEMGRGNTPALESAQQQRVWCSPCSVYSEQIYEVVVEASDAGSRGTSGDGRDRGNTAYTIVKEMCPNCGRGFSSRIVHGVVGKFNNSSTEECINQKKKKNNNEEEATHCFSPDSFFGGTDGRAGRDSAGEDSSIVQSGASSPRSGVGTTSKFRSRLNSVRDELYFHDDL